MSMSANTPARLRLQSASQHFALIAAGLIIVYILLYILPLGIRPMVIPDETRYAEIPREMLQSGDWAVPHLNGLRYFEKPPLGYWLNAVSIRLFGETPFAVRLSSALAAGLSAWLVWLLVVRAGVGRKQALAASAVYLGLLEVLLVGTFAVFDTLLALFLTGGMVFFYLATEHSDSRKRQRWRWLISGVWFGLAFLTKGFLAFVIPGMVLGAYCLLEKRFKPLFRSIGFIVIGLSVIVPWAIIVHLREPDFWHYFIWEEHIHRFLADDAQHAAPAYYYLAALPALAFPWVGFIPAIVRGLRTNALEPRLLRFLLLWLVLPFLFFSISKGKLATYILPCFAPIAILTLSGVFAYLKSGRTRGFNLGVGINAVVLLAALAAFLIYNHQYAGTAKALFSANESGRAAAFALLLSASLLITLAAAFVKTPMRKIMAVTASVIPLFLILNLALPARIVDNKSPVAFFQQTARHIKPDSIVISDAKVVRAVTWVLKRDDLYLTDQGEMDYGLRYPEHRGRLLSDADFAALLKQQRGRANGRDIVLFCKQTCDDRIVARVPDDAEHYFNGYYTVWIIRS